MILNILLLIPGQDPSWAILKVADPPSVADPSVADDEQFTYITDLSGNIVRMAIDEAPNDSVPFFEANKDTDFELFTLKNPAEPQILLLDNPNTIEKSNFNSANPTRIFIHGW